MYFAKKNDSDVSQDEEELAQNSSAESDADESDSYESQIDEDGSDDSDDDDFEVDGQNDVDDDEDNDDDDDDDDNDDDDGDDNDDVEDNGDVESNNETNKNRSNNQSRNDKQHITKKLKEKESSSHVKADKLQKPFSECKTAYLHFPGVLKIDFEAFIRSFCKDIVKVRLSSEPTARFCLVDFKNHFDCINAIRVLRQIKLGDRSLFVVRAMDSSDEYLVRKTEEFIRYRKQKGAGGKTPRGNSKIIKVMHIPAAMKAIEIMEHFPNAVEFELKKGENKHTKYALITFPNALLANEAKSKNISIHGWKMFMQFYSLPNGSKAHETQSGNAKLPQKTKRNAEDYNDFSSPKKFKLVNKNQVEKNDKIKKRFSHESSDQPSKKQQIIKDANESSNKGKTVKNKKETPKVMKVKNKMKAASSKIRQPEESPHKQGKNNKTPLKSK